MAVKKRLTKKQIEAKKARNREYQRTWQAKKAAKTKADTRLVKP